VIDRQLHRLARLIDDLIDMTRLRVNRPSLHISRVDFRQLAQDVVDALTPHASAKAQHLTIALPRSPVLVDAESVRIQQVLSNLLTNAIGYTEPRGFIRVSIDNKGMTPC
jgi:two-component system CheB/CheR fusion protein